MSCLLLDEALTQNGMDSFCYKKRTTHLENFGFTANSFSMIPEKMIVLEVEAVVTFCRQLYGLANT